MPKFNLYLMGYRGLECIKYLIEGNYVSSIAKVIVARDTSIEEDYFDQIISLCCANRILCCNRANHEPSKEDDNAELYSLAISWRWILNIKRLIIFHDSILPKYRGFSPLVSQLINKEKVIGVSALLEGEQGYDSGKIISQSSCNIEYPITIYEGIKKTTKCYLELLECIFAKSKNLDSLINLIDSAESQNHQDASYSLWRDHDDYLIDWNKSSEYVERFVNATGFPYNGAQSRIMGERVYILEGNSLGDVHIENRVTGKILMLDEQKYPLVVCGYGLYRITRCLDQNGQSLFPNFHKFRIRFQ